MRLRKRNQGEKMHLCCLTNQNAFQLVTALVSYEQYADERGGLTFTLDLVSFSIRPWLGLISDCLKEIPAAMMRLSTGLQGD